MTDIATFLGIFLGVSSVAFFACGYPKDALIFAVIAWGIFHSIGMA